jgi:hypothetical protein
MYYALRDREGHWSDPIEIGEIEGPNRRASHPQLVLQGEKLALIYTVNQSAFLRRGVLEGGTPKLGQPVKIAAHTAQLMTTTPQLTGDDRIVFLSGADTVWKQTATIKELLKAGSE